MTRRQPYKPCPDCGRPTMDSSTHRTILRRRGAVRRSTSVNAHGRCVDCANGIHASRPPEAPRPRYCHCDGYRRHPDCLQECQFCHLRIHPKHDDRIPEEIPCPST